MLVAANDRLGDEISAYWQERATSYSNGVRGELGDDRAVAWRHALLGETAAARAAALDAGREPRALDLGCGPGFFSILLAEDGWSVDAVDASANMLAQARANAGEAGVGARMRLYQGDVAALPFEDGTFDIAVARNLTWLMRDPEAAYAEWLRVLRPGGVLLVFDANWYLYLTDPVLDAARLEDQEENELEGWDEDAQATSAEELRCEQIAAELPLTPIMRPTWDLDVLQRLGASEAIADPDVWKTLWTESEKAYYATSPMFMVRAVK